MQNDQLKQIIKDMCSTGFSHINTFLSQIKTMNINVHGDVEKLNPEQKKLYSMYLTTMSIVADVIHPAFGIAPELFPDALEFVKMCINNHKLAIENKMFSGNCECARCKIESKPAS